jgi:hypothetical protein
MHPRVSGEGSTVDTSSRHVEIDIISMNSRMQGVSNGPIPSKMGRKWQMWLAVGETAGKNDWTSQGVVVVRLCGQKMAGGYDAPQCKQACNARSQPETERSWAYPSYGGSLCSGILVS